MNTVQSTTSLRRWAVVAVVANVVVAVVAALALPSQALPLLPVLGLSLALLTTGVLDACLDRRAGQH